MKTDSQLIAGQPAEWLLRRGCELYVRNPKAKPDANFVRHLMEWLLTNVPQRPLTPRAIAVLIDRYATGMSREKAIRRVHAEVEGPDGIRTVDTFRTYHNRHGLKADKLKAERNRQAKLLSELIEGAKNNKSA